MSPALRREGWLCLATLLVLLWPSYLAAALPADPDHAAPVATGLGAAQIAEDLELSISALEAALPDLYWHQSKLEWEDGKARARAASRRATDAEGLYAALRPLISQVGEGHMVLARSDAMKARERLAQNLLPLDTHWTEAAATVTQGYGQATDIPTGTRIESINGEPVSALVEELMAAFGHDGRIATGAMRDGEGIGYALARYRLRGTEQAFDLKLAYPDGRRVRRTVHGVPYAARPRNSASATSPLATLAWPAPHIALLRVPTFSNRKYRSVNAAFPETMQGLFAEVARNHATSMILDLRDNGGGSEGNENLLFSYLVKHPIRKYRSVTARGQNLSVTSQSGKIYTHQVFDDDELRLQTAVSGGRLSRRNLAPEGLMSGWSRSHPVFSGKLVVLAGGNTFSGGAELSSMLAHTQRGRFLGEEVAGTHAGNTSGYLWDIELPNSEMILSVPLLQFQFGWKDEHAGRGVLPEIAIAPPPVHNGPQADNALARALQLLTHNRVEQ
ncbi:MAG TPA: S41 family peptidase [Stenotrophomonas sp.]|jgi:C-terminal processing protease CtpA/Prc